MSATSDLDRQIETLRKCEIIKEAEVKELSPDAKVRAGERFLKDTFWKRVLEPAMQVYIAGERGKLETCTPEELLSIQMAIRALDTYLKLPEELLEKARDDLALKKHREKHSTGGEEAEDA